MTIRLCWRWTIFAWKYRLGSVFLSQCLRNSIGDNLRRARHLKYVVKAQPQQRRNDGLRLVHALKLRVQRRRRQRNRILEIPDEIDGIRQRHFGMMRAYLDALAAVDAALMDDARRVMPDADSLRRAPLQAGGAACTLASVQADRMQIWFWLTFCIDFTLCILL